MENSFGLSQTIMQELLSYFKTKSEIQKVLLFGSRAKGTFHNGSDIDLAIQTENKDKIPEYMRELDELPTPYKFDVVNYKTLTNENLKNSIDKDGIVVYQI